LARQDKTVSPEGLVEEVERAKADWLHAWQNFREAEGEFVKVAVYELKAKEEKYRALLRMARG
jgi:Protein of unknown function (DUF2508).